MSIIITIRIMIIGISIMIKITITIIKLDTKLILNKWILIMAITTIKKKKIITMAISGNKSITPRRDGSAITF